MPTEEFRGKSGAGHYGDFSVQVDDVVGQVMTALEDANIADNTLLIYTSDNGAHWLESDIENYGHLANNRLRGQKADIHEGGHRVPFIVRWPGRAPAGAVSHQLTTLTDLMATTAAIVDTPLADDAAEDSFNILASMLGEHEGPELRPAAVHHALDGMFAIRKDEWKLIEGLGSGGFTAPVRSEADAGMPSVQLYNLSEDPKETTNVADSNPDVVAELRTLLDQYRSTGRSR